MSESDSQAPGIRAALAAWLRSDARFGAALPGCGTTGTLGLFKTFRRASSAIWATRSGSTRFVGLELTCSIASELSEASSTAWDTLAGGAVNKSCDSSTIVFRAALWYGRGSAARLLATTSQVCLLAGNTYALRGWSHHSSRGHEWRNVPPTASCAAGDSR